MKTIPLRRKDGWIRAYALVDDADYALLSKFRWSSDMDGYAIRTVKLDDGRTTTVRMHRVIVGLERGDKRLTDHINRDRLDNRRDNLRFATVAENAQHRGPRVQNRSSRFRGVSRTSVGHWIARVRLGNPGRLHNLGTYVREEDAAEAAAQFRREHMPFSVEPKP